MYVEVYHLYWGGGGHSAFVFSVFQFCGISSLFLSGYILGFGLLCFNICLLFLIKGSGRGILTRMDI